MYNPVRITTVDNPYDPFEEWDEWYLFDKTKGYHTCERLASISKTSPELSDAEINDINDAAIDQLIRYGAINKNGELIEYKKVYKNKE